MTHPRAALNLQTVARLNVAAMAGSAQTARELARELSSSPEGLQEISDALATALSYGNDEAALELIPLADVGSSSGVYELGRDALLAAAASGCQGAVAALIDRCDPKLADFNGDTALTLACRLFNPQAALALIPHSDPAHVTRFKTDALDNAIQADGAQVALALLDAMEPKAARARALRAAERARQAGFFDLALAVDAWSQARAIADHARPGLPSRSNSL